MSLTKQCSKCNQIKPLTDFFNEKRGRFQKSSYCKDCYHLYKISQEYKLKRRTLQTTQHYHDKIKQKRNTPLYRVKHNAQEKTRNAIKKGLLIKPNICSTCGELDNIHAHHPDYSQPLQVVWLCSSCHRTLHKNMNDNAYDVKKDK